MLAIAQQHVNSHRYGDKKKGFSVVQEPDNEPARPRANCGLHKGGDLTTPQLVGNVLLSSSLLAFIDMEPSINQFIKASSVAPLIHTKLTNAFRVFLRIYVYEPVLLSFYVIFWPARTLSISKIRLSAYASSNLKAPSLDTWPLIRCLL
jgi:hypothetical protein